ncbi:hypothetical protein LGK95_21430 [Clostridium algoriphilum]|uniref:hypothetical protein n=1 Tax=Clostridium algoriphilum TaxID=198347 RepID=UPI001CF368BF|nr:hypothetical protein [Clostridium algoriphilum]MCB2296016.1 hypothetical protein [Clostridium algoriphilum]
MRKVIQNLFRIWILYLISVSIVQKDMLTLTLAILAFLYEIWIIIKEEKIEKEKNKWN